ncbi:Protein of unknown function [Pyronema omphalodes CBS 100304]|uniref:Uncharacterized protein n=1 Tax=Pyronema omphalodes (strain CBS 100304) TaxID=1076935 RepID=U4LFW2_PYROM|nr:Protein of unknown function [Pyronema omphalodes CBS 100304]
MLETYCYRATELDAYRDSGEEHIVEIEEDDTETLAAIASTTSSISTPRMDISLQSNHLGDEDIFHRIYTVKARIIKYTLGSDALASWLGLDGLEDPTGIRTPNACSIRIQKCMRLSAIDLSSVPNSPSGPVLEQDGIEPKLLSGPVQSTAIPFSEACCYTGMGLDHLPSNYYSKLLLEAKILRADDCGPNHWFSPAGVLDVLDRIDQSC